MSGAILSQTELDELLITSSLHSHGIQAVRGKSVECESCGRGTRRAILKSSGLRIAIVDEAGVPVYTGRQGGTTIVCLKCGHHWMLAV